MLGGMLMGAIAIATPASAQKNGQVITQGSGYTYMMSTPAGWESIPGTAREQGLRMIVVPQGSSWESSQTVIYSNVTELDATQNETMIDLIDHDMSMYRLTDPNLQVNVGERFEVDRGKASAVVVKVHSPRAGTYEAIAYIPEGNRVPFIVMSSIDEAAFERDYEAFEQLVNSFKYYESTDMVRGK